MYKVLSEKAGVDNDKVVRCYLVDADTDLPNLPNDTAPSSIAHTVGFGSVWEMGLDDDWHEVSVPSQELMYRFNTDNGYPYIEG